MPAIFAEVSYLSEVTEWTTRTVGVFIFDRATAQMTFALDSSVPGLVSALDGADSPEAIFDALFGPNGAGPSRFRMTPRRSLQVVETFYVQ